MSGTDQAKSSQVLEEQAIYALLADDENGLADLFYNCGYFNKYYGLYKIRFKLSHDDALDKVQILMMRCWFKRHQFNPAKASQGASGFRQWLNSIAGNIARDHFRELKRRPVGALVADSAVRIDRLSVSPDKIDILINRDQILRKLFPPNDPDYLLLHYTIVDELPMNEIAKRLNIAETDMSKRCYNARKRLEKLYNKYGTGGQK